MTATLERRRADYLPPVDRATYLGSTDIAAIHGLHPYRTPRQVFEQKMGIVPEQPTTDRMQRGKDLEPYCARCYSNRTGVRLRPMDTRFIPGKPYLGATPDYRLDARYKERRLVEIKTHGYPGAREEYGPEGTDDAPTYELVQCQWEMHVAGYPVCDLAVWFSMNDWGAWTIAYDPEWGAELEQFATEWWETHIKGDIPPPLIGTAVDCEYIKRRFAVGREDVFAYATPEIEAMIEQHREAKSELVQYERHEAKLANQIREFMGEASVLHFGTQDQKPITWRNNKPSEKTDWEKVARALDAPAELIAQHTIEKPGARVFRVPYARE